MAESHRPTAAAAAVGAAPHYRVLLPPQGNEVIGQDEMRRNKTGCDGRKRSETRPDEMLELETR